MLNHMLGAPQPAAVLHGGCRAGCGGPVPAEDATGSGSPAMATNLGYGVSIAMVTLVGVGGC